ncbi:MAG TPA: hypothetical protein VF514_12475 [Bacteroidota bacterium]
MRYTLVALLALIFTGCDERNEVIDPGALTFPLRINLRAGQSIRLPQLGFIARFDSVTSDSRCPQGALCVWEGDGATRLSILRDPEPAVTCTLHTTLNPRLIEVGSVLLQLKELDPYPQLGHIINQSAYVAVLEIDRIRIR